MIIIGLPSRVELAVGVADEEGALYDAVLKGETQQQY